MTCHYGKESAALVSWLTDTCNGEGCAFNKGAGCNDPVCKTGKIRTLLATTPVGCDDVFDDAWATLRRTCGQMDGVCCPTCAGPIMTPCDKHLRPIHKQTMSVYTATAAMALAALLLKPAQTRQARYQPLVTLPTRLKTKLAETLVGF